MLDGPILGSPSRAFCLLRFWAICPKFQEVFSCRASPVRLPAPAGSVATAFMKPKFHPRTRGKAFLKLSVHGGLVGSVARPAFQSVCSTAVSRAHTFGAAIAESA